MDEDDDLKTAEDVTDDTTDDVWFPDWEPSVPSCYEDCWDPELPVGYSDKPPQTRVVALDRNKYDGAAAVARFEELQAKHGWRTVGEPFWTGRFWCWRIWDV